MIKTRLIKLLSHAKKYVVFQILWKYLALVCQIITVYCFSSVFVYLLDADKQGGSEAELLARLVPVMAAAVVRCISDKKAEEASFRASADVKRILRGNIYEKLLSLGAAYRQRVSTAELVQLSTEGVEQLETYFGKYLAQFFYSLTAPIVLFLFLMRYNARGSIVLLIGVPLMPLSIMAVQKIAKKLLSGYWGAYADLGDSFLENLQGLTTLKIYQADEEKAKQMDAESEHFRRITMKVLQMQLNSVIVMDVVAYGGAAAGMVVTILQYVNGRIELFGALLTILLAAEFFLPLRLLGSFFHVAMNGMAASDKIFAFLDLETEEQKDAAKAEPDTQNMTIELADVGFAYQEDRMILSNMNVAIPANTFLSVVGESGSGKSTLAGLIMGRNKGYTGSIKIAGRELKQLPEHELFSLITYISHESYIIKGTVRSNLKMAKAEASDTELYSVLERVNLAGFVKEQPGGLDMEIAEKGGNLSGGQRQRLALARALLHDTPAYIFDEATSNIDVESETSILHVIHELAKTKMVILISHRLANVVDSDRILMMEEGRIAEEGTHEELISHASDYAKLYQSQMELERYSPKERGETKRIPVMQSQEYTIRSANSNGTDHLNEKIWEDKKVRPDKKEADEKRTQSDDKTTDFVNGYLHKKEADDRSGYILKKETDDTENVYHRRRSGLQIMGKLIVLVKPLLPVMFGSILFGVAGHLCAISLTIFASHAVYNVSAQTGLLAVLVSAALLRGILHYAEQYCNHFIAFKLLAIIRHKVFAKLRTLAPAKLEGRDKGNLISIITSDIELLEVFYAHTISPIAIAVIVSLVMTIVIGRQDPFAGVIAMAAYLAVGLVIPLTVGRLGRDKGMEFRDAFGDLNSFVLDSLYGIDETLQYGNGEERFKQLDDRSEILGQKQLRLSLLGSWQGAVTNAVILFSASLMLACMTMKYNAAPSSQSVYAAWIATVAMMGSFGPVSALASLSNNLNQTLASGERVLSLLEEQPAVEDPSAGGRERNIRRDTVDAEASHVFFSYDDRPVLRDCSLEAAAGRITGIHGASGSGKSTLLKLWMRFWYADDGQIRINGTDVREIPTGDLRNMESLVTQDTILFHDTIGNNIRISRLDASQEEVVDAAKKASIHEWILSLPDGYDTMVGEQGDTLSGGERQRIGIARAFLHDAPFILLDEPTSNLDSLNEAIILKALKQECENKTILLVSHRASTLHVADVVFEMDPSFVDDTCSMKDEC